MSDFERFCEVSGICPSSQEIDDLKREIENDCDEECRASAFKNNEMRGLEILCYFDEEICGRLFFERVDNFCSIFGDCPKLSD